MKKTLAAIGASVLGLAGALGATAAPASAALPACTDATDHVVNPAVSASDDWYMTCIPQYGMGKAEFSITTPASDPFPAGFSLDDGKQAVVSTPSTAQTQQYFTPLYAIDHSDTPVFTGPFLNLVMDGSSTPTEQSYGKDTTLAAAYPVVSVGKSTAALPAECTPASDPGATYEGEYVVTYAPVTAKFSETVGNIVRSVTVTYTPAPLFLALNFDTTAAGSNGFSTSLPQCVTAGGNTTFAAGSADFIEFIFITGGVATYDPNELITLDPATANPAVDGATLGSQMGAFAATSTPVLATTGVDAVPAGVLGLSLLATGVVAFVFGRRRRANAGAR
jgi:hypothetical protein